MLKAIIGVIVGYIVWTAIWLGGWTGLAVSFAEKIDAETGATEDVVVLVIALVMSVVCSVAAGATCKLIQRRAGSPAVAILGAILLATGLFVQISGWDNAPVWYHIPFLLFLYPATMAGGRWVGSKRS